MGKKLMGTKFDVDRRTKWTGTHSVCGAYDTLSFFNDSLMGFPCDYLGLFSL